MIIPTNATSSKSVTAIVVAEGDIACACVWLLLVAWLCLCITDWLGVWVRRGGQGVVNEGVLREEKGLSMPAGVC
jgi:hypothetical protein